MNLDEFSQSSTVDGRALPAHGGKSSSQIRRHLDFYDPNYKKIYFSGSNKLGASFFQRKIASAIPKVPGGIVLELGARDFDLTERVAENLKGARLVLGLDLRTPSPGAVNRDDASGNDFRFLVANAEDIPLPDNTVSVIFHGCFLHHLRDPLRVLTEIRRVLLVGGTVVYYLPCHPGLMLRIWQRLFSNRHISRVAKELNFDDCDPTLLDAVTHIGHYLSIKRLISAVHSTDSIKTRSYPLAIPSWNLKAFEIITVKKLKDD